jgi:hypothetical protein
MGDSLIPCMILAYLRTWRKIQVSDPNMKDKGRAKGNSKEGQGKKSYHYHYPILSYLWNF